MNRLNCLVIYDEPELLLLLLKEDARIGNIVVNEEEEQITALVRRAEVDLVFCGLAQWKPLLFAALKQEVKLPPFVFISRRLDKYKEDIHEQVDYHLKEPIVYSSLQKLLTRVQQERKSPDCDFMFIKYERRYHRIYFDSIELVEKAGPYVKLFTADKMYMIAGSLQVLLAKLPPHLFTRCCDQLIVPAHTVHTQVRDGYYFFRGRAIRMNFKYLMQKGGELVGKRNG